MIYFWQETLSSEFTHFFRRFFWTEKQNVQTFLLIGCICWLWSFICSYPCFACFWLGFLCLARCLFVNLLCIIAVRLGYHIILAWASLPQIWYSADQSVKGVKSRGAGAVENCMLLFSWWNLSDVNSFLIHYCKTSSVFWKTRPQVGITSQVFFWNPLI